MCNKIFLIWVSWFLSVPLLAGPLSPVKTDSPSETMRTFMESMELYRQGVAENDSEKKKAIDKAVRTLDLSNISLVLKKEAGVSAAIYLKEVIDRVIIIDYEYIPPGKKDPQVRSPWRLKDTEITIVKKEQGDRQGEFLFSSATVERSKEFFDLVKDLPYLEKSGGGAGYQEPWLQKQVPPALKGSILGVFVWQWLGLFLAIFLGFFVKYLTGVWIAGLKKLATKSESIWDDRILNALEKPAGYGSVAAFWFLALLLLRIDGLLFQSLSIIVQVLFSLSLIWVFYRLADVLTDYVRILTSKTDFQLDDELVPMVNKTLRVFTLVFGSLIAIQNLGVNVMSVVAGLGLGGLAFALAAKDTAANLFGSLMILSDQPFKVGDWVKTDSVEGTVEKVGFRSTRIRTFYNSQVSVPNAVMANVNIDNMGRRRVRRVKATLGVTYDTPPQKLEEFIGAVKEIIIQNEYSHKENMHVVFSGYGDSSLEIMVYFFLDVPDWSVELKQRGAIYLSILKKAETMGVSFAFPTRTLHIESPLPPIELSPKS